MRQGDLSGRVDLNHASTDQTAPCHRLAATHFILVMALSLALSGCQATDVNPSPPGELTKVLPAESDGGDRPADPVLPQAPDMEQPVVPAAEVTVPEPRRVAILLPLTGRAGDVGQTLLNAAQLALFDFEKDDFELLVFDTRGTPEGASEAARGAIDGEAGLILGPFFGGSAEEVRAVAAAAGVNVISFSNNREVAGNGVFVFGFLPDQQVRRVVTYAAGHGHDRFAALVPSNGFGQLIATSARQAAGQTGGSVVISEAFDPSEPDLSPFIRDFAAYERRRTALMTQRAALRGKTDPISRRALRRLDTRDTLGELPFDSVILPLGGADLRRVASLLAYYDVDPARIRFLGTAIWDESDNLGTEPALVGSWYAAPPPGRWEWFEKKFVSAYEAKPARLATLGYDAVGLAVTLSYGEGGPDYSAAALTHSNGFDGVDGVFRFLADGTSQRGLAVLEIGGTENLVVDPAATIFPDPDI